MIKSILAPINKKISNTFYIVGILFRLTTRFCSLTSVGDPIKEANYDHCNTIQKICVIFNI